MRKNKISKENKKEFKEIIEIILKANEDKNKYQLKQLVIDLCFCISRLTNYNFSDFDCLIRYYHYLIERGVVKNEI